MPHKSSYTCYKKLEFTHSEVSPTSPSLCSPVDVDSVGLVDRFSAIVWIPSAHKIHIPARYLSLFRFAHLQVHTLGELQKDLYI
jgi:hypothetical protein